MGGQQSAPKESPYAKYFNCMGNPYNKTMDEKLNDLRNELKAYAVQVWDDISMLYCHEQMELEARCAIRDDMDDNVDSLKKEISSLRKENDFLKAQITNGSTGKWGVYANKDEVSGTVDMLRQMMGLMKQDSDKLKSKFESASNGFAVVKPTVDVKQMAKVEPQKDVLDGWMNISDLTHHVGKLIESGKIKCNDEFGRMGSIGDLLMMLNIVKIRGSSLGGRSLSPTGYGESIGVVKEVPVSKTSKNCYYNVEKCKELLEEASKNTLDVIRKHKKASENYYAGATA